MPRPVASAPRISELRPEIVVFPTTGSIALKRHDDQAITGNTQTFHLRDGTRSARDFARPYFGEKGIGVAGQPQRYSRDFHGACLMQHELTGMAAADSNKALIGRDRDNVRGGL